MADLLIFEEEKGVRAGFTRKPDRAAVRRNEMALQALDNGGFVLRPLLVHGKRIEKIDEVFLRNARAEAFAQAAATRTGNTETKDTAAETICYAEIPETDGLITNLPGVVLTSTHGDCIPVWAYDPGNRVVGLAHAGWKGTLLCVAGELIRAMQQEYGCNPADIRAYIGPGIDLCHFEVGPEVAEQFREALPWSAAFIHDRTDGKSMIDLKGINRQTLENAGVKKIAVSTECTYCEEDIYYSYRRCRDSERMLAYIELL